MAGDAEKYSAIAFAGTIEFGVMQNNYGGFVEYATLTLLVLQIVWGRSYLKHRRPDWPRPLLTASIALMVLMWAFSASALFLTWTGFIYTSRIIPVGVRAAVVAIGYFWMLLSWLGILIAELIRYVAAKIPGLHSPARRTWLRAAGVAAVCVPAAPAAFGAFIERNQYGVDELDLPVPGLHPDFDGYRIVQVSDLHVSPFLSPRDAARAIDMANELRADLALFTGDLISERGDPLDEAIRELIRLRGADGVLGCMGNHEAYIGCRNYLERKTRPAGLNFLRSKATQIRRGQGTLNIAGVDYERSSRQTEYLIGAERLVVPDTANILLSHNPDVFPTAIRRGYQAVLSGHTHGGQVNVEILHQNLNPARFRTPFISGLYRLDAPGQASASCYVTNGIGTIGMPIRLGAPPEIALLRLRRP
jgi:hypothetical protein